jgi:oligosaccharide repeat unit polymerase
MLFLILFLLLALPIVNSIRRSRGNLLSAINLFRVLYMISFVIVPVLIGIGLVSDDPAYANYEKIYESKASILSIVALLAVYCSYYLGRTTSRNICQLLPGFDRVLNERRARLTVGIIWIVSTVSFAYLIKNSGLSVGHFSEHFIYTNVSTFGKGHLAILCYSFVFASVLCVIAIFSQRINRKNFFIFFLLLGTLLAILTRSRGQVIYLLFVALVVFNYRVRRVTASHLATAFILVLAISFSVAQFRGQRDYSITRSNMHESFGGLFTEYQATAALLSEYETQRLGHFHGRLIFEDLVVSLIPRKIWRGKPELYGGIFLTNILIPNRQDGFYYTIGPFGTAFGDFGYPGVMLAMLLAGLLLRIADDYMGKNRENDYTLLIYAICCFFIWAFLRGGFSALPTLLQTLIPAMMAYFFASQPTMRSTPVASRGSMGGIRRCRMPSGSANGLDKSKIADVSASLEHANA